jgi:alpha-L-rhamnosidase
MHARAHHITPYGLAESSWKIENGKFQLNVIIPPNTTALITLPDGERHEVGSGVWNWQVNYQDPDTRGPFTVDDLTGDIMNDKRASSAIVDILVHVGAPEFVRGMIFSERNVPLRQSLHVLPNYEKVVIMMNDALAAL